MTPEYRIAIFNAFGPVAVSAIVSLVVARYTLKRSPDYQKQLNDLKTELGRLSAANEEMLTHQKEVVAEEKQQREASAWKPRAYLKSDLRRRTNELIIESDKHFRLEQVEIMTTSGAVVSTDLGVGAPGTMIRREEFNIPHQTILALVSPDSDYRLHQRTTGRLRYTLNVGHSHVTIMRFELSFRAVQEITDSTVWTRLEG